MLYHDYGSGDFLLMCWCSYNALNESRELLFYITTVNMNNLNSRLLIALNLNSERSVNSNMKLMSL